MDKLRVNTGLKKIEVNDAGEYITVNMADRSFGSKFQSMYDKLMQNIVEIKEEAAELEENISDKFIKEKEMELCKITMNEIDTIFGEGSSRKIFGEIVPDVYAISDFFEQLFALLGQYTKERQQAIGKYSPGRKGIQ